MKILTFCKQPRSAFIYNFMDMFKTANVNEKLPKITECQFMNQPFTVIEKRNCFVVEAKDKTVRFNSAWTVANWVYKTIRIRPHDDD